MRSVKPLVKLMDIIDTIDNIYMIAGTVPVR